MEIEWARKDVGLCPVQGDGCVSDTVVASEFAADAEMHLALLSACPHTLLTVGTFGWWGAFLAPTHLAHSARGPSGRMRRMLPQIGTGGERVAAAANGERGSKEWERRANERVNSRLATRVTYYAHPFEPHSPIARDFNHSLVDFYPPEWTPLGHQRPP